MDFEKKRRKQRIWVFVAESMMVVATIAVVTILAFVVSGYWISRDTGIERTGILQVSSIPTLGDVEIDGDGGLFQRTNTSKTVSAGNHTVKITKDGYDSWTKTVTVSEGLIYRLRYPRLFLTERETEEVYDLAKDENLSLEDEDQESTNDESDVDVIDWSGAKMVFSPEKDYLLLVSGKNWEILRLDNEEIEAERVTLPDNLAQGEIEEAVWSGDENKVLVREKVDDKDKWLMINLAKVSESVDISAQFGADFDEVEMLEDSGSRLLVRQGENLRTINLGSGTLSKVLAERVVDYAICGDEVAIVYETKNVTETDEGDDDSVAEVSENAAAHPELAILDTKSGEVKDFLELDSLETLIGMNKFYDNKEIVALSGQRMTVYRVDDKSVVFEGDIDFEADKLTVGPDFEFVLATKDAQAAVLDMEGLKISDWTNEDSDFMTIDNNRYLFYSVTNGELSVCDFDGLNERTLANGVSRSEAGLTDDKWIYYISGDKLMREQITE